MAERLLSEVAPALLRPGGLQDLAAAALERTLAADPGNAHALWKLAEIHRRQGDFAAARGLYRRLRTRGPDRRKAAWLHRELGGDGPQEAAPGGLWPAPFVWMRNFLAPGECDRLLALGAARRECFTPAGVGDPSALRVDPGVRITLEADPRTMEEGRPRIGPKIRSVLPDVLARLGMPGLDHWYSIDMGMRVYLGGGFYRAHSDSRSMGHRPRVLSFVYFFHREPRRFSGGDLLLYDTDVDTYAWTCTAFSRIVPLRNSIVFFPSACWHQVCPVQCETDDFGDGRWAVNGHVSRCEDGGEA